MSPDDLIKSVYWLNLRQERIAARATIQALAKSLGENVQIPKEWIRLALEIQAWDVALRWLEHPSEMRAYALHRAGRFEESVAAYDQILRLNPGAHSVRIDKALSLQAWGAWDQAARLLRQVFDDPQAPQRQKTLAQYKLGWHVIREGDFRTGMKWNKLGRRLQHWGAYSGIYHSPMLQDSETVNGKTILVVGEAGQGDEILNFRFGRELRRRGARVIYQLCHPGLEELLSRHKEFYDELVQPGNTSHKYDRWVAAQDLPVVLDLEAHQIGGGRYLTASPISIQKWRNQIPRQKSIRVGLRWRGAGEVDLEQSRALPEEEIANLVEEFPQFDFFSFEQEKHAPIHPRIRCLGPDLRIWDDTAAALSQMDFVISSCTSLVHMAGALGVKTFVLNQTVPYYIWAGETRPSSWYESVTPIKKQTVRWTESFRTLARVLLTEVSQVAAIKECPNAKFSPDADFSNQLLQL